MRREGKGTRQDRTGEERMWSILALSTVERELSNADANHSFQSGAAFEKDSKMRFASG